MALKDFFYNNQKIIIIIGLLIVAFIIYRYFWQEKDITKDLNLNSLESRLSSLESKLGSDSVANAACQYLDPKVQQQIADEIKKKLAKIDVCDCAENKNNKNTNNIDPNIL